MQIIKFINDGTQFIRDNYIVISIFMVVQFLCILSDDIIDHYTGYRFVLSGYAGIITGLYLARITRQIRRDKI